MDTSAHCSPCSRHLYNTQNVWHPYSFSQLIHTLIFLGLFATTCAIEKKIESTLPIFFQKPYETIIEQLHDPTHLEVFKYEVLHILETSTFDHLLETLEESQLNDLWIRLKPCIEKDRDFATALEKKLCYLAQHDLRWAAKIVRSSLKNFIHAPDTQLPVTLVSEKIPGNVILFSHRGTFAAIHSGESSTTILNTHERAEHISISGTCAYFSRHEQFALLAHSEQNKTTLIFTQPKKLCVKSFAFDGINPQVSPDEKILVTTLSSPYSFTHLLFWNLPGGTKKTFFKEKTNRIIGDYIVFSPCGNLGAIVQEHAQKILLIDLETMEQLTIVDGTKIVLLNTVAIIANKALDTTQIVHLMRTPTPRYIVTADLVGGQYSALSANEKVLVTQTRENESHFFYINNLFKGLTTPFYSVFHTDLENTKVTLFDHHKTILVSNITTNTTKLVDAKTKACMHVFEGIAVNPDPTISFVVIAGTPHTKNVIVDTKTGKIIGSMPPHETFSFSPDQKTFAFCDAESVQFFHRQNPTE